VISASNVSTDDQFYALSIEQKIQVTETKKHSYTVKVASDGFSLHEAAWVIPSLKYYCEDNACTFCQ